MFNFLKGRMGGQQQGGGFMQRMQQGIQRPQFQQGMAGLGAQMMGLDPALGQMAAQGMQNKRLQRTFDSAIQPIAREQLPMPSIDPRALMPQGALRKPMGGDYRTMPVPSLPAQAPMGVEGQGGGAWQDPRLAALYRRNPLY